MGKGEQRAEVSLFMNVTPTRLPGVLLIEPRVFQDDRGAFFESWHKPRYEELGIRAGAQDNISVSRKGVLRGLHYQLPHPQAKLVQVLHGVAFDVAVDIRPDSPTYRQWVGVELSAENRRQIYIPEGFAHGFCALTDHVILSYKCSEIYHASCDKGVAWNDPDLAIDWPISEPLLSPKDQQARKLADIPREELPSVG